MIKYITVAVTEDNKSELLLLPEVLLLISLGTPDSEIRRMFNG